MPHYVITGASGHIGNNLVRYINAAEPQAKVTVLTRRAIGKELDGANCVQAVGNVFDQDFLQQNLSAKDTVIHLAGLIDLSDKLAQQSYEVNYLGTKAVCDVCRQKGVDKFVYVGSVDGIYRDGDGKIAEPLQFFPDKVQGNYGKTKALAMQYVAEQIQRHSDFNAAIVMPSAVIGVNDFKPSAVGKVVLDTLNGKAEFGMKGGYNFVNVTDVCQAIFTLCHGNLRDSYILSGYNVSVEELYGYINKIKGFKRRPIIIPNFLVKLSLPFVKVLNKITVKSLQDPHDYDCSKAERDLGYTRTPAEETIRQTVEWFDQNKKLFEKSKKKN